MVTPFLSSTHTHTITRCPNSSSRPEDSRKPSSPWYKDVLLLILVVAIATNAGAFNVADDTKREGTSHTMSPSSPSIGRTPPIPGLHNNDSTIVSNSSSDAATTTTTTSAPWALGTPASKLPDCNPEKYQNALREAITSGASIILGANVGPTVTDPVWELLLHNDSPLYSTILVEPIPPLFEQLVQNAINATRKTILVNAAIATTPPKRAAATTSDDAIPNKATLTMYCLGTPGQPVVTTNNKTGPEWLSQVCSTKRERLFSSYDVGQFFTPAELERLVTNYTVPLLTLQELLESKLPRNDKSNETVEYLQVDVEGIDDLVVLGIDFSSSSFPHPPQLLVWEHVLYNDTTTANVNGYLQSEGGYRYLCNSQQNVVASTLRDLT